jgi:hypothetical protein
MADTEKPTWRPCSSCKKSIPVNSKYYVCSVSTCTGARTNYVFCSVPCFERHLPIARHRDAGAVEQTAPGTPAAPATPAAAESKPAQAASTSQGNRVYAATPAAKPATASAKLPREVLIIASRLKEYVHARSEYNTSGSVMEVLSDHVRIICDRAIDNARAEGRKTVMDRDFEFLKKS